MYDQIICGYNMNKICASSKLHHQPCNSGKCAKICVEALLKPSREDPWRIAELCSDTLRLAEL